MLEQPKSPPVIYTTDQMSDPVRDQLDPELEDVGPVSSEALFRGAAMYIKQSDLLLGTSMDFVKKFMDIARMVSHGKGDVLFHENDESRYFYILLNGHVRLSVGEGDHAVYDIAQNGEAFGWSSLIGRDVYSASAQCVEPSKLLVTDRNQLSKVLEEDPSNGMIFVMRLAATLGNRLIETYKMIPRSAA